jgi:hypothetical protein
MGNFRICLGFKALPDLWGADLDLADLQHIVAHYSSLS